MGAGAESDGDMNSATLIPDGFWRCQQGHKWSHPPGQTECPVCGAIEDIVWLNWSKVEAAIFEKNGYWPGERGRPPYRLASN